MTTPTSDNLRALLARCADEAPASFRDQRQAQGFSTAGDILTEARAAGIDSLPVLSDMLKSKNPDEVWLALVFLPIEALPAAGIATLAFDDLYEDVQSELRVKLGLTIARGLVPYDAGLRRERQRPGGRGLLAAQIAYDHDWVWHSYQDALGPTLPAARFDVGFALAELGPDEVRALREELAQNTVGLPDDWAATLAADVDRHIAAGATFSSHVQGVRFTPRSAGG